VEKGFLLIPHWQAWMREKQPRLLFMWDRYDLSFELSDPGACRRDVPKAEVHILGAGHFALDTLADEIAALVRGFLEFFALTTYVNAKEEAT
jgi:hypothetical protein